VCDVTAVVFNARPDNGGLSTFPPGESTYTSDLQASTLGGIEVGGPTNFGRVFVKGLSQAVIKLGSPEPSKLKVGDWILDSTMILPDYNDAFPLERAPFLDEFDPRPMASGGFGNYYRFPPAPAAPLRSLQPGLVGGHFYKVLDISEVRRSPFGGPHFQTITLDRPAKSDGFTITHLAGIADVITKGVGKMPQK
jgi:hypothetical protein